MNSFLVFWGLKEYIFNSSFMVDANDDARLPQAVRYYRTKERFCQIMLEFSIVKLDGFLPGDGLVRKYTAQASLPDSAPNFFFRHEGRPPVGVPNRDQKWR